STRARTRSDRERIPTSDFPFATGIARKPALIIFSAASGKTVSGVSSGGTWRTVETLVLGGRFLRRMSSRSVTTPTIFFRSRTGSSWTSWVFIFPRASPIVSSGATVTRSVVMKSDTRRSWTLFRFMVSPLGWEAPIAEVRIRKFFQGVSIHEMMETSAIVVFRGRVEGVYFGGNCDAEEEDLGLQGYVSYMPDGSG